MQLALGNETKQSSAVARRSQWWRRRRLNIITSRNTTTIPIVRPNRNQIFDSSGPDVRVRGNAHQVFDKYQALAREAGASGDRVMAEAYWQYADHYFRLIQTMGGLMQRNNQGWGEGGEEGQGGQPATAATIEASLPIRSKPTAMVTAKANIVRAAKAMPRQGGQGEPRRGSGPTGAGRQRARPRRRGFPAERPDGAGQGRPGCRRAARRSGVHAGDGRPTPLSGLPRNFERRPAIAPRRAFSYCP